MLSAVFVTWGTALSRPHHFVGAAAQTLRCHSKDFPYSLVSFKHTAKLQEWQASMRFLGESGLYTSSLHPLLTARWHIRAQWNPEVHRGRGVKMVLTWQGKDKWETSGCGGLNFIVGWSIFFWKVNYTFCIVFACCCSIWTWLIVPEKNADEISLHSRQYFL